MTPRNPSDVLTAMVEAYDQNSSPQSRVLAVRDAMLTPAERGAVNGVASPDDRDDDEWHRLDRAVSFHLMAAVYTAPEIFFAQEFGRIGNTILRQCEIDAINATYN